MSKPWWLVIVNMAQPSRNVSQLVSNLDLDQTSSISRFEPEGQRRRRPGWQSLQVWAQLVLGGNILPGSEGRNHWEETDRVGSPASPAQSGQKTWDSDHNPRDRRGRGRGEEQDGQRGVPPSPSQYQTFSDESSKNWASRSRQRNYQTFHKKIDLHGAYRGCPVS